MMIREFDTRPTDESYEVYYHYSSMLSPSLLPSSNVSNQSSVYYDSINTLLNGSNLTTLATEANENLRYGIVTTIIIT